MAWFRMPTALENMKVIKVSLSMCIPNLTMLLHAVDPDSHLTKVMREYHLRKARTPAELPDWLFSERERGKGGLMRSESHSDQRQEKQPLSQIQPVETRRGRHDGIAALAAARTGTNMAINTSRPSEQPRLVGSDRLKQMRSIRRNHAGGDYTR